MAWLVLGASVHIAAQAQTAAKTYDFAIAAKPVRQALNDVGSISGMAVAFGETAAASLSGNPVNGTMSVSQALSTLLSGTGLTFRFTDSRTISITAPNSAQTPSDDGSTTLAPITVIGAGGATITEETGSYTANTVTIGKTSRTLREIPQSVSVITRQQIEDQNLTSVADIIGAANGATIVKADEVNERSEIYLRGFTVDSLQVDGTNISANHDVTTFDPSIYDHVEVLRGPAGILQGAREPGGTVNLVRKRPQDKFTAKADTEIGSWNRRRAEVDVGGPLVDTGEIRGRLIATVDRGDSFIDLVNYDRRLLYGVLDFDVTDNTTLTVGGTWQEGESRNSRGLPAYADGTLLHVPRSTYIGADWEHSETRSADVFAKLEHRFDSGATWNLNTSYLDRDRDGKLAFADAAIDPITGNTRLLPEHRLDREDNFNIDSSVTLPVEIGGLTQTFLLGADYYAANEELDRARSSRIPQNVFDPNHNIPEPDFVFDRWDRVENEQYGLYGQAQIKPAEWATLVLGGRLSWWHTRSLDRKTSEEVSKASIDAKFTPTIGGIIDVSDNTSIYASYASIFVPQDAVTVDNTVLPAREGKQYEVGVKSELLDGVVNGRLSVFHIEDTNRAVSDPNDPDFSVASGKVRSQGFEAELSGEILPSWEVTAGYTFLASKFVNDRDNSGVFEPRSPRHSVRIWSKYSVEEGRLAGLSLGGGLNVLSETYRIDDGTRLSQGGYATVDLQLGYKINEHVRGSLTVTNLFDKTYYQSVGLVERQTYYGAPRAISFKLSSTF